MKNFTQKLIGLLVLVFAISFEVNAQEIGDIYEGGYIFQINDDGTGLVADLEDLCVCSYSSAFSSASSVNSQGYNDWFIPSPEQMNAINYNIGPNSNIGNIAGLSVGTYANTYWVTGEYEDIDGTMYGYYLNLAGGTSMQMQSGVYARRLRMIRPFNLYIHGCTDEDADNFSSEATFDDGSCIYSEAFKELQALLETIVPEDGVDQDDVDSAFIAGVSSIATQNIPLDLPQGWSMFGYTCVNSIDAMLGFSNIADKIEIVKDEWGLSYIPSWEFNAMGSLQFSEGYQIKMIEEVIDFQFCTTIAGDVSQEELDAAIAEVHAMYEGWCESDIDNDGICDVDEVSGCMADTACNYVLEAEFDDGSCDYVSCLDECGVINGDNSSCLDECGVVNGDNSTCTDECGVINGDNSTCIDCAGVVNGTSENLGCGCGNPVAQEGYDCDGNLLLQIGDEHAGGIVFQINEDGTGLVANLEDLTERMNWFVAMSSAQNANLQGYDDWYLPSIEELQLIYNTIGPGIDNAGNFLDDNCNYYWSSAQGYNGTWYGYRYSVNLEDGSSFAFGEHVNLCVRIIRAF